MGMRWSRKPTELNVASYTQQIERAVERLARETALRFEAEAKTNAPWNDDTGAARNGLRGEVAESGGRIVVYGIHSVEYGVDLELGYGGRYAIVRPTMDALETDVRDALQRMQL